MHSTGLISNLSNKFTHGRGVIYVYLLRGGGLNSCLNPCYIYARPVLATVCQRVILIVGRYENILNIIVRD